MNNYILAYYQAIKDGSIIVGKWILLFYTYIVDGLSKSSFLFDVKKANKAIRFVEEFCHHCEGRNDLIQLELWQKAALSVIFGIVDADGLRHFREIVLVIARKNGKTLFAAAILTYCIYCDGEYGAKAFCVAPKLDQADLVYSSFWQIVKQEPDLAERIRPRKGDYYIESTNSSVKKIAFNAKKSDGFNPHIVVCDEIASWPGDKGLKQYDVMKSAVGARTQPLLLSISTSGYENEGIYDELIKRSTRVLLGDSRERRLCPLLYMIDDVDKWSDINELQKSNPNLGVSVSVDYLLEEIAIAEGSLSKRAEFLTKYCNIKQNSSQAWLPSLAVENASGTQLHLKDFKHCYCVGGIDLSRAIDLTACCVVIEKNEKLYVFAQFFLPKNKLEEATARDNLPYHIYVQRELLTLSGDNAVDYRDCFDWFEQLRRKYEILPLKVGYDRAMATYLVQDMRQVGYDMDDVYQGYNLTPVIHDMESTMKDGDICIGDNDLLKVHLLNAALKTESESGRRKLVKLSTNDHIDGTAALLDAMTVRQKWYGEVGELLKNKR